jgi:alkylation response protein AidB-like acyl-CoA dehydrogenase
VTFAKVDGERFTAFLVERSPGLRVEREEHKLGLHGSSTCRVVYDGVVVPAANRLGEEGEGAYVALYTLNLGRFKIGAAALGIAKEAWRLGRDYACERTQFGRLDYRVPAGVAQTRLGRDADVRRRERDLPPR